MLGGCNIIVKDAKEEYPAVALGVDDDAHLIVRDEAGKERILYGGEVSALGIYKA